MPKKDESTMKWKVDITQLKAGMVEARRSITLANAEFKSATAGLGRWQNSITGVEAKLKQLNNTLPQQKAILERLQKQYDLTAENMGENSAEAQRLKIQIENQKAAIAKTEAGLGRYSAQLKQMRAEEEKANSSLGQLNKTINAQEKELKGLKEAYANAVVQYGKHSKEAKELASQIDKLSSNLAKNQKTVIDASKAADKLDVSLANANQSALEGAQGGFTVLKGALANLVSQGISRVITGMKEMALQTFEAGSNFEEAMSKVGAISGASAEELQKLTDKAKEMGAKTKFSATQSAEAFNYMAMAGWKTGDMLEGIEGIMSLAAASNEDLATTSDIVTDALTAMGYSAKDAGRLADVMAAASSNANTNVAMMGQTFQYAAPIVGALGYKMEDTAVAIGLMANAGIKGEKAGTALRSILTRLSAPPKECADAMDQLGISLTDSNGKMKSFDVVMNDLRKGFSNLSETEATSIAKHIAGQEAMSGLLAIVKAAPKDYDKLTKAVNNSNGAAKKMADTMENNAKGSITKLKSKIEGVMIKVYEKASASIVKSTGTISKALDKVNWDKFAKDAGKAAENVAKFFSFVLKHSDAVLGTLKSIAVAFVTYKAVATITNVVTAFKGLITAVKAGQTVMAAFNATMALNPYALAIAGVAALVTGLIAYKKHMDEVTIREYGLSEAQQKTIDKVSNLTKEYKELNATRQASMAGINAEFGHLDELKAEYNSLVDSNGKVKKGYEDRANFILTTLAKAMGVELEDIKKMIDANGKLGESIDNVLQKKRAEALLSANEEMYNKAIKDRAKALREISDAQKVVKEAHEKYNKTQAEANEVLKKYDELLKESPEHARHYYLSHLKIIEGNDKAKESYEKAKNKVKDAQQAYIDYNATIQNYEGLSAAIISGDSQKITTAMANLQNGFITAETGNKASLERQLKNYKKNLQDLQTAIEEGTPAVTQDMVDQAKSMVDAANAELDKLPPSASKKGKKAGKDYADGVGSKAGDAKEAGRKVGEASTSGEDEGAKGAVKAGETAGAQFAKGVGTKAGTAKTKGKEVAGKAKEGADSVDAKPSGEFFGKGFISGIGSTAQSVWDAGVALAKKALKGLKAGGKEGSPWKTTIQSGKWAGEGLEIGLHKMIKPVSEAGYNLAQSAVKSLSQSLYTQMKKSGVNGAESLIKGLKSVSPKINTEIDGLKANLSVANSTLKGDNISGSQIEASTSGQTTTQQVVNFNQTINSPKPVDRLTVYQDTNDLLFSAKVRLSNA